MTEAQSKQSHTKKQLKNQREDAPELLSRVSKIYKDHLGILRTHATTPPVLFPGGPPADEGSEQGGMGCGDIRWGCIGVSSPLPSSKPQ